MLSHVASLDFQRVNHGFTPFRHRKTISDPDSVERCFRCGRYATTPLFCWVERSSGICTWAWVKGACEAGRLSKEEAEAVRQNAAMGISAGISVSLPEVSARSKGAVRLIADPSLTHDHVERILATPAKRSCRLPT